MIDMAQEHPRHVINEQQLCCSGWKVVVVLLKQDKNMNTAPPSENGPYAQNNTRPFFYAQPTAQQPFPNPWYLGQVYNPYCLPAPGFRSGNPYFPFYSVALQEYPGFYVPQPPIHTRMTRRPHFNPHPSPPMFYHATRFRHFSSPGKRTECKETQTDVRQQENKSQKNANVYTNTRGCDAGNMACLSSGVGTETESNSENVESSPTSEAAVQEREFHKNACTSTSYRNLLPGSYAFEKEEVRIEYGGGSPAAIQLWKSYKETIPLYDVAADKDMADGVLHRDVYSVSSCQGIVHGPRPEGEEMAAHNAAYSKDDCRAALPPVPCVDAVHEKDIQSIAGRNHVGGLEPEKTKAIPIIKPSLDAEIQAQSLNHPELSSPTYDLNTIGMKDTECLRPISLNVSRDQQESDSGEQDELLKSSLDEINNMHLLSTSQIASCKSELQLTSRSSLWAEDAAEGYVPSSSWLACFDNMETNCSYDMCLPQRKQKRTSVLSITSDDLSSRDEGSSMDNAPASFFVPDYMLRKSIYSFRKSTDSSERERIKSGGSLNEDEECVRREQTHTSGTQYSASQDTKGLSGQKVKAVSGRNRKLGVSLRDVTRKKLYSLKKKPRKNMSLSEPEDSEDYWVVEENIDIVGEEDEEAEEAVYFLQESTRPGQLSAGRGKLCKPTPPHLIWKPSKSTVQSQLVRWPSCDQMKTKKKGLSESSVPVRRSKQNVPEVEREYGSYVQRPAAKQQHGFKEVPEQRTSLQRSLGGKSQKKNVGMPNEEYWAGRGAKPKFSEEPYDDESAVKSKQQGKLPRRRGLFKASLKSKPTLSDPEEADGWVAHPKPSGQKGHGTKKTFYPR